MNRERLDALAEALALPASRRRTLRAALAALVAAGRAGLVRAQATPGAVPPFYDPPDPLPASRPGELIRTEPLTAPAGAKVWRFLAHSTTYDGHDVAVSGLVAAPDRAAPAGGFPVVSVAHGTQGMARTCAPSLAPFHASLGQSSFFDQMVAPFIAAGYAVAATDYRGLGTPGVNPYLVGADAGRNLLDAARTIRVFPGLALAGPTLLWGHSQGGQAAAFAGQLAPSYAPDLRILGAVLGSPAAELGLLAAEAARVTGRSPLTGLLVMIVRAWSAAYPGVDPASALTALGVREMGVVDRECVEGVLLRFALRPATAYLKAGATTAGPWPGLIAANTPGAARIAAPVLVFQGETDELIRPQFTQALVRRLCAFGEAMALKTYPGRGHIDVIEPAMPDTLAWMADRLAGKPAPSSCGPATPSARLR